MQQMALLKVKLATAGAALNTGLLEKYVPENTSTHETKSWGPAMRI